MSLVKKDKGREFRELKGKQQCKQRISSTRFGVVRILGSGFNSRGTPVVNETFDPLRGQEDNTCRHQ